LSKMGGFFCHFIQIDIVAAVSAQAEEENGKNIIWVLVGSAFFPSVKFSDNNIRWLSDPSFKRLSAWISKCFAYAAIEGK